MQNSTLATNGQVFTFFSSTKSKESLYLEYSKLSAQDNDPFGDSINYDFTACQASVSKLINLIAEGSTLEEIPAFLPNLNAPVSTSLKDDYSQVGIYFYYKIKTFGKFSELKSKLSKEPSITSIWKEGEDLGLLLRADWVKDFIKLEGSPSKINFTFTRTLLYIWNVVLGFNNIELDEEVLKLNYLLPLPSDKNVSNKLASTSLSLVDLSELAKYIAEGKEVKGNAVTDLSGSLLEQSIMQSIFRQKQLDKTLDKNGKVKSELFNKSLKADVRFAAQSFYGSVSSWSISKDSASEFIKTKTQKEVKQYLFPLKEKPYSRLDKYLYRNTEVLKLPNLKEGEYLAKYFEYSNFSENTSAFKVIIDAPTGVGKNIAIIKNARKNKTIVIVPLQKLIKSILMDVQKYAPELKVGVLYEGNDTIEEGCDLYVTSFNSFAGKGNNLLNRLYDYGYEVTKDFLLVIDEIHTINYDRFKQLSKTDRNFFINIINNAKQFKRFIGLTGTLNSTLPLEVDRIIEVRRDLIDIPKSFGFIVKDSFNDAEDWIIIKKYLDEGYFPLIYKQNTKKAGWRGKMEEYALSENLQFGFLNAKEKVSKVNSEVIDLQKISEEWSGLVITSAVREGVSTFFDKSKKVVCLMFDPVDTDTAQQISHRIRNASEVLIVNVVTDSTGEWNYEKAVSFDTGEVLSKIDKMVIEQLELFNNRKFVGRRSRTSGSIIVGETEGVKHLLIKLGEETVKTETGSFVRLYEKDSIAVSQMLTARRNNFEKNNLLFAGWLGVQRYGWEYKGRLYYKETALASISEEMKRRKKEEALDFNQALTLLTGGSSELIFDINGEVLQNEGLKAGEFKSNFNRLASSKEDLLNYISKVQKESTDAKLKFILDTIYIVLLDVKTINAKGDVLDAFLPLINYVKESNQNKGKLKTTLEAWNLKTQYERGLFNIEDAYAEQFVKIFDKIKTVDNNENRASSYEDLINAYDFKSLGLSEEGRKLSFDIVQSLYERGGRKKKTVNGKAKDTFVLTTPKYIESLLNAGIVFDGELREVKEERSCKDFAKAFRTALGK